MMKTFKGLLLIGAALMGQHLFAVSPDVLKYPAMPSPNRCTEQWGPDYFLRSNGYCQACSTVGEEYQIYYGICDYVDSISLTGIPVEITCGDKRPMDSLTICRLEQEIASAMIIKESSGYGVKCAFNKNWGHNQDYIWTTHGCQATFKVCLNDGVCKLTPAVTPTPVKVCHKYRPGGWIAYKVVSGDTLSSLAARTGSWTSQLKEVNCISDINHIIAGTYLYLPRYPVPVITIIPGEDTIGIFPIDGGDLSGGRDPVDGDPGDLIILVD